MKQTKESICKWLYIRKRIIIKMLITTSLIIIFGAVSYRCKNDISTNIYNIFASVATAYIVSEYYRFKDSKEKYNYNIRIFIKHMDVIKNMICTDKDDIILEYFISTPYRDILADMFIYCKDNKYRDKEKCIKILERRLTRIEKSVSKYSKGDYKLSESTKLDIQFCILKADKLFL